MRTYRRGQYERHIERNSIRYNHGNNNRTNNPRHPRRNNGAPTMGATAMAVRTAAVTTNRLVNFRASRLLQPPRRRYPIYRLNGTYGDDHSCSCTSPSREYEDRPDFHLSLIHI